MHGEDVPAAPSARVTVSDAEYTAVNVTAKDFIEISAVPNCVRSIQKAWLSSVRTLSERSHISAQETFRCDLSGEGFHVNSC